MAAPSHARNSRELPGVLRPPYVPRDTVRNVQSIPVEGVRLIYFDHGHATELLEHIASSATGRSLIGKLADSNPTDLLQECNQRSILARLIAQADDLETEGTIDLHQPVGSFRRINWKEAHPDQAVAIRGMISAAKEVQRSSLLLQAAASSIGVFFGQDHFLHLNQSYLTAWPLIALGKVRSVPRMEILAAAIGVVPT